MNTEKLEKLKKSLDNKFIPDNVKDKIRNEIEKLESEIKSNYKLHIHLVSLSFGEGWGLDLPHNPFYLSDNSKC